MKKQLTVLTAALLAGMATGVIAQGPPVNMTGNVWLAGEQPPAPPPLPSSAPAAIITGDAAIYYESLRPFGTWFQVTPFGHVWRPTEVVNNPAWRPYMDSGSWLLVNNSWYWQSNYAWGWAPFHYGRWMKSSVLGWVWIPGTEWSGAWVTWRETPTDYQWAPMPVESAVSISISSNNGGVDWGFQYILTDGFFISAPRQHFHDRNYWSWYDHPHHGHDMRSEPEYREPPRQVEETRQTAPSRRTTTIQHAVSSPRTSTVSTSTHSTQQKVTKQATGKPAASSTGNEKRRPSRVQDIMARARN